MRRVPLVLLFLFAAVLTAAAPALAHTPKPIVADVVAPTLHETLSALPPAPSLPWAAVALLAAVATCVVCRQRRAVAVTLVLVVALLAFETGVHSTHHLGKADDATHCVVASMSTQVSADVVHVVFDVAPAPRRRRRGRRPR